jgi:hypothetical protein
VRDLRKINSIIMIKYIGAHFISQKICFDSCGDNDSEKKGSTFGIECTTIVIQKNKMSFEHKKKSFF